MDYLWIGLGGFAGASARAFVSEEVARRIISPFPYGTLIINVSGSLAIGIIMTLLTERWVADPAWRLIIVVGFLGGYTTFSSYTFQAITLMQQGHHARALAYILSSNVVGLVVCYLGIVIARAWVR